jgi:hypothetical protein
VRPHRRQFYLRGKTLTHKAVEARVANEERLLDVPEPDDQRAPDHDLRAPPWLPAAKASVAKEDLRVALLRPTGVEGLRVS